MDNVCDVSFFAQYRLVNECAVTDFHHFIHNLCFRIP